MYYIVHNLIFKFQKKKYSLINLFRIAYIKDKIMELIYLALAIAFTFFSIGVINVYTRPSRRSDPFIIGGLNKVPIRIPHYKVLIVVLIDILFWLLFYYKITN